MKKIPLTRNKFALVDDDDFEWLSHYKWTYHHQGYAYRQPNILMHRLIMGFPKLKTDHKDSNRLNNQRENLRLATDFENSYNRSKLRKTSSIYKGVHWSKKSNKWLSYIKSKRKKIHIGYFDLERHAALAYDLWAKELFGQFAKLNLS